MKHSADLCPDGQPPRLIDLVHPDGMRLKLMDWGGTWLSCRVAPGGEEREVLLGCQHVADYFSQTAFLGATIGRYANRIGNARFTRAGQEYRLLPTKGGHQLHGGPNGFDRRRWRILEQDSVHVLLGIESPDGDQGFPGNLVATVCYRLADGARINMEYSATVDAPCPVNLTNHSYFNLDGTATDVRQHRLRIRAAQYLPIDAQLIPSGHLAKVDGTSFDYTRGKLIGQGFLADAQQKLAGGYDHAYLLDVECHALATAAATLVAADGRLAMDLYTSKPALQF